MQIPFCAVRGTTESLRFVPERFRFILCPDGGDYPAGLGATNGDAPEQSHWSPADVIVDAIEPNANVGSVDVSLGRRVQASFRLSFYNHAAGVECPKRRELWRNAEQIT